MDVNSLMMILVVVFAGFLIYSSFRRQKRQFQALRDMIASLKPGDEVMTRGGLYGKIVSPLMLRRRKPNLRLLKAPSSPLTHTRLRRLLRLLKILPKVLAHPKKQALTFQGPKNNWSRSFAAKRGSSLSHAHKNIWKIELVRGTYG